MTISDLINRLKHLPPSMLVYVPDKKDGLAVLSRVEVQALVGDKDRVSRAWDTFRYDIQAVVVG